MAGAGVFLEEGAWRGEGSPAQTVSSPVRTTSSPAQGRCRTRPRVLRVGGSVVFLYLQLPARF